jgi:magnesium-protoporphyrin IX monomethyl ester (oxidative) cyclase
MNMSTTIESVDDANSRAVQSHVLSPRFYTTDFAAMDRIDVSAVREEWDAVMQEYEGDNNHDHFQRDAEFAQELAQSQATTRSARTSTTPTSSNS